MIATLNPDTPNDEDEYNEDENWFDPCQSACGPECPYFCSDCLE